MLSQASPQHLAEYRCRSGWCHRSLEYRPGEFGMYRDIQTCTLRRQSCLLAISLSRNRAPEWQTLQEVNSWPTTTSWPVHALMKELFPAPVDPITAMYTSVYLPCEPSRSRLLRSYSICFELSILILGDKGKVRCKCLSYASAHQLRDKSIYLHEASY